MPRSSGNVRLFVGRIRDILGVTGLISDDIPFGLEFGKRPRWWHSGWYAIYVTGLGSRYALGELFMTS